MEITASVTVRNNQAQVHTTYLPRGMVIEAASAQFGVQNIALLSDYYVTVPAGGIATVRVVGRCLNQGRRVPHQNPGRVTPFKYGGIDFTQKAIWQRVGHPVFM
jgi:hypothetical protein